LESVRGQILEEYFGIKKKGSNEDAEKLLKVTLINFRLIIMPISQRV
jgi:hypothetical protein